MTPQRGTTAETVRQLAYNHETLTKRDQEGRFYAVCAAGLGAAATWATVGLGLGAAESIIEVSQNGESLPAYEEGARAVFGALCAYMAVKSAEWASVAFRQAPREWRRAQLYEQAPQEFRQ